jgi:hypothetical protein
MWNLNLKKYDMIVKGDCFWGGNSGWGGGKERVMGMNILELHYIYM